MTGYHHRHRQLEIVPVTLKVAEKYIKDNQLDNNGKDKASHGAKGK